MGKLSHWKSVFKKLDEVKFEKRYGVPVRSPEIGVTLSHQRYCRKMIAENISYVLVMADNIAQPIIDMSNILCSLEREIQTDTPKIILLSAVTGIIMPAISWI